jgi:hypothetical protein
MKPIDIFLTKEAFEQHALRLREEKAREYGMTLEQWDEAVRTGATISHNTQHPIEWNSIEWNGPTSSFNG